MLVTVEMFGEEETFLLGSREIADGSLQVYSEQSPIGSAVNGKKAGDVDELRGAQRQADRRQDPLRQALHRLTVTIRTREGAPPLAGGRPLVMSRSHPIGRFGT